MSLSLLFIYLMLAFKYSDMILVWLSRHIPSLASLSMWKPLKSLGALAVCISGILLVIIFRVDRIENGSIATIGFIPSGLPPLTLGHLFTSEGPSLLALMKPAIVIGLVNLLESLSIAKSLSRKHGESLDINQEITALGLTNLAGFCLSAPPTTGSFSRSAVGNNAGEKVGGLLRTFESFNARPPLHPRSQITWCSTCGGAVCGSRPLPLHGLLQPCAFCSHGSNHLGAWQRGRQASISHIVASEVILYT